jgi:acetylornithine deacetylase/succinyl-diaminopimelate desuccinylase-like protein
MSLESALAYARLQHEKFLAELKNFIRFPTISADPKHAADHKKCAAWLAAHLQRIGMQEAKVIPTKGRPLVYAEWRRAPGKPTVLVYGHYDVQPVDPLNEWKSPPFQPTVRGNDLFGRGACDDKGQLFTHIKALESYLASSHRLPVNVKCLFEGEEEIRSPNLLPFIARNRRALRADVAVMSDTQMLAPNRPAINYAERGALSLEVSVYGPQHDLHSGNFGGIVHNPVQALGEMIAQLHDVSGRIAIPGFYDRVRDWSAQERARMRITGPTDQQILKEAHIKRSWGERGFTLYERITIRPALIISGITGGYQGPGEKGVVPASATVKLGFRLVPDQDPAEIERLARWHIARITPPEVRSEVRAFPGAKPALVNPHHPVIRAASLAYRKSFGVAPVFLRSGGTIPVVSTFQQVLGVPTVLMGFALPDDRIHAPNEKFHLPNFYRGIETCLWFMAGVSAGAARRRTVVTEVLV